MQVFRGMALVVALLACTVPGLVQGDPLADEGPEAMAGLGLLSCASSGDARCSGFDTSYQVWLSGGYRFLPYFGAYLDVTIGGVSTDVGSGHVLTVMPTLRGILPLDAFELMGGVGLGYAQVKVDTVFGTDVSDKRVGWLNYKFSVGASYRVIPMLALGVNAEYLLRPAGGERCGSFGGVDVCVDNEDDLHDFVSVVLMGAVRF